MYVWFYSRASDRLYARKMELVFIEIRVGGLLWKGAALCLMQSPLRLHSVRERARSLRFLNVCEPRILVGALERACFREIRVGVQVYEITHVKDEFSRYKIKNKI